MLRTVPSGNRTDNSRSASSKFASDLIDFAANRGADRQRLISLTGLPLSAMDREDVRIPCTTMSKMWSAAMAQTGERQLGLSRTARANHTTALIMEASSTVFESFQLAVRYSTLIADVMAVELGESDGHLSIEFTPTAVWREQPDAVQLDCLAITYVSAVSSLGRMLGTDRPPSLLSLTFDTPSGIDTLVEAFGRSPDFGADHNRIGFPAELKSESVTTGDPGLKAAIQRYADELSATIGDEPRVMRDVMSAVADRMDPSPPSLDEIARSMGMSRRSLQRSLRAEGTSFRAVVERVRIDRSEQHLRHGALSVDEVARLVGYADTSSFVRAFKRSKGQPPRQFARRRSS